jgi:hypothetical protein
MGKPKGRQRRGPQAGSTSDASHHASQHVIAAAAEVLVSAFRQTRQGLRQEELYSTVLRKEPLALSAAKLHSGSQLATFLHGAHLVSRPKDEILARTDPNAPYWDIICRGGQPVYDAILQHPNRKRGRCTLCDPSPAAAARSYFAQAPLDSWPGQRSRAPYEVPAARAGPSPRHAPARPAGAAAAAPAAPPVPLDPLALSVLASRRGRAWETDADEWASRDTVRDQAWRGGGGGDPEEACTGDFLQMFPYWCVLPCAWCGSSAIALPML